MHHALIFNNHNIFYHRPLGAYRIASILREQGWDVEVVEWAAFWDLEELKEFAKSRIQSNTVFCGFSCFFSYWDEQNFNFVKWIKESYSDIKIITGSIVKPLIINQYIDYFVYGFGENALLAIVSDLVGNSPVGGLKLDPRYTHLKTKIIDANHSYPSFPMKSLMVRYENRDFIESAEWLTTEFGRGCIFECLFCNFPVLGVKGDYSRDQDDFYLQMMDNYDRFGVKNYFVSDETFNDRSDKIIKFADVTDRLPFRPFMTAFVRGDLLVSREQDWEHLSRLGVLSHFYGVETLNHESGKMVGKGMHPEKLKDGLLKAREHFLSHDRKLYRGSISLICGLPKETKESTYNTIDWIKNYWVKDYTDTSDISPLDITINDHRNKFSKLSKSWKDLGYTELNEPLFYNGNNKRYVTGFGRENLIWKNNDMDINWARKTQLDFYEDPILSNQGAYCWLLNWGELCGFSGIEETLKIKGYPWIEKVTPKFHSKVIRYKAKKLNVSEDQVIQEIRKIDDIEMDYKYNSDNDIEI